MKKMITTLTLLTFLVVGAFAQTSAPADRSFKPGIGQPDCPEMERRGDHRRGNFEKGDHYFGPKLKEMLDLTDQQVEKMHKIKIKYEKNKIDLNADAKKLKIDKQEAMKDMDFDKAKKITKELSDIRTKMQIMKIDQKQEITKLLNKEQIEKMKKLHMMNERMGKKGKKGRMDKKHCK
ncbi:MAG: Spy/CpxP family protein refolding chaperone [Candidatus Delongbacteria bacterium]|jgi:hypothetical protein|nr:Spy/CpxP family protein refolding chaperone [Candidatus Delongbacteria bacterium]